MIGPSMKKFFKPVIPSSQYSSIPYLNASMINIGGWIQEWCFLQPHKKTEDGTIQKFILKETHAKHHHSSTK